MNRVLRLIIFTVAVASMPAEIVESQVLTAALDRQYGNIGRNVDEAAEMAPEAVYAFRPTDEVRTFGQLVGHVANSQYSMCAAAAQETAPSHPNYERDVTNKAELVTGIKASTAYCQSVFAKMTDADMTTVVDFYQGPTPIGAVLAFNTAHSNEHYGNMVTYLRLRGLVPPSTARSQSGSAD